MRDVFMCVCLSVCVLSATKKCVFFYPNSTCSILYTAQCALCLLCYCLHNIFHIRICETTYIKYRLNFLLCPEGDQIYGFTPSLTSMLEGVWWTTRLPDRLTPRENIRCPLYRRLVGPQGRSGQVRKISHSPGFDPRTVQPVGTAIPTELSRPTVSSLTF